MEIRNKGTVNVNKGASRKREGIVGRSLLHLEQQPLDVIVLEKKLDKEVETFYLKNVFLVIPKALELCNVLQNIVSNDWQNPSKLSLRTERNTIGTPFVRRCVHHEFMVLCSCRSFLHKAIHWNLKCTNNLS